MKNHGNFGYDWNSAHGVGGYWHEGKLIPYTGQGVSSVALMDALAKRWGLQHGQVFMYGGHIFRYDDRVPNGYRDKYGRWHPYNDLRMDIYDPYKRYNEGAMGRQTGVEKPNITINYHAPVTIHGGDSDAHTKLAAIHRKHIDQMSKDVAEVMYRDNRARFDGSRAI